MNIIEAIKSGKLMRRKSRTFGYNYVEVINHYDRGVVFKYGNNTMPLLVSDILANDWEIKKEMTDQEKLTMVKKKLDEAITNRNSNSLLISELYEIVK